MGYLALYRKFRPKTFDGVIGQEHIVRTLINQIKNNSVSHAYLFCGTRGTGKTSCAKIFAKAINCENNTNGSPCLQCDVCNSYVNSNNLDIVEIDAASNNRVDEIRDLREKVNYYPTVGKYKVYIIDEVHMLTDSAFNALLKTLEEPPAHAVFILCTTEVHKLPATILSRCTRFDFRLVSNDDLENHLKNVFKESNIKCDNESLKIIAKAGQGSVRDCLSAAEMCASYCDNNITYAKAIECLGITENDVLYSLANAIIEKDTTSLITTVNKLIKQGKNLSVVLKDLSNYINNVLITKLIKNANEEIALPASDFEKVQELSQKTTESELLRYLNNFANVENSLKLSLNPNTLVEITLLGCIVADNEIEKLKERVEELEKKTLNSTVSVSSTVNTVSFKEQNEKTQTVEIKSLENTNLNAKQIFGELIQHIKQQKLFMLYAVCGDIKDVFVKNNDLVICCNQNEYDIFKDNLTILNNFVSNSYKGLKVILQLSSVKEEKKDETAVLKEKFGEKLIIK